MGNQIAERSQKGEGEPDLERRAERKRTKSWEFGEFILYVVVRGLHRYHR
jgi:hypothetical protein